MISNTYFIPSFGNKPKELVGRSKEINTIISGLSSPVGSKERATLITGQRGYGKTVLLLELAERAAENGFITASPTVTSKGMLERIVEKIQDEGEKYLNASDLKLSGGTIGALGFTVGLQFDRDEQETKSFTYKLSKLCRALEAKGKGVLILVDEVQASSESLQELIIAYQELVGEGRNLAIAMAGLPGAVSSVLNNHVLTFLNRAGKIELGPLKDGDIRAYYTEAFSKTGLVVDNDEIEEAVKASMGSPYMMQLIGYYVTSYAGEDGAVNADCLNKAINAAGKEFMTDICKTALNSLSDADINFIKAMAVDKDSSKINDISTRLGVSTDYVQRYKRRLIDSGIITQERRGEVKFAVPYLKDYILNSMEA